MGHVAGVATHIKCGMTASLVRNIQALGVALEAEVLCLVARGRLQQLILIVGFVRAVAFDAVAHRRRMNRPLERSRVHVRVAGGEHRVRGGGDNPYVSGSRTALLTTSSTISTSPPCTASAAIRSALAES